MSDTKRPPVLLTRDPRPSGPTRPAPAGKPSAPKAPAAVSKEALEAMLVEAKAVAQRLGAQAQLIREIKGAKAPRVLGILAKLEARINDLEALRQEVVQDPDWDAKEILRQAHVTSKRAMQAMLRRFGGGPGSAIWEQGNARNFLSLVVSMARELHFPVGLAPVLPDGDPRPYRFLLLQLPEGQVSFKVHRGLLEQAGLQGMEELRSPWDGHDTPTKNHRIAAHLAKTNGQAAAG